MALGVWSLPPVPPAAPGKWLALPSQADLAAQDMPCTYRETRTECVACPCVPGAPWADGQTWGRAFQVRLLCARGCVFAEPGIYGIETRMGCGVGGYGIGLSLWGRRELSLT